MHTERGSELQWCSNLTNDRQLLVLIVLGYDVIKYLHFYIII